MVLVVRMEAQREARLVEPREEGGTVVVALAVLEDAVHGLANISDAAEIQAAVKRLVGDWFKLGGNVGVDPLLFKTRTLVRPRLVLG
jgi:hypothetical protein